MDMLDKLKDLGKHIAALDSGSGDAAAVLWGVAEIERLRAALKYIADETENDGIADIARRALEQGAEGTKK